MNKKEVHRALRHTSYTIENISESLMIIEKSYIK